MAFPKHITATARLRAVGRTAVFVLKVLPMLPSGFLDRVTVPTVKESLRYPSRHGPVDGDLYRPATPGPHPGMVVCLGVVPFGVEHPQVARLGEALARSGFAALLYWSPAMRDLRLDANDVEDLALAYDALLKQPFIDRERSGLFGTCVGGSFALMAAAHPLVNERVGFAGAFAPFADLRTFARDIASASTTRDHGRQPWAVDQLTRNVYVRTMTQRLQPDEAEHLRSTLLDPGGHVDVAALSADARLIVPLLSPLTHQEAVAALDVLPKELQATLTSMSPLEHVRCLRASTVLVMHDRDDDVIPIGESRQLHEALSAHPGLRYTEFAMFQHADPTKRKLRPHQLARQLGLFLSAVFPLYRQATMPIPPRPRPSAVASVFPVPDTTRQSGRAS